MLTVPSWPVGFVCCVVYVIVSFGAALHWFLSLHVSCVTNTLWFPGLGCYHSRGVHGSEVCPALWFSGLGCYHSRGCSWIWGLPVLESGCKELCVPQQPQTSTGALNWDTWVVNTFAGEHELCRQWGTIMLLRLCLWILVSIKPSLKTGEKELSRVWKKAVSVMHNSTVECVWMFARSVFSVTGHSPVLT